MNMLKTIESTIAGILEGAFGRVFRSEVRPVELARKLAREMDQHRTESLSHVYAPNEFSVWLSPRDRARYEGVEAEVIDELCAYLLEHARREDLILVLAPRISFHTDPRLALGEFGIQAQPARSSRAASAGEPAARGPSQGAQPAPSGQAQEPLPSAGEGGSSQTMIYSTSARVRGPLEQARALRSKRAQLLLEGRPLSVPLSGGTIGRSRSCDIVLSDSGVSRKHAELRPSGEGWTIADLGSTNGLRVNGVTVTGSLGIEPGDRIELGSTELVFELA
ncbi:MAG: DUF2662 domain-containing protein [Actinobacteria bacterium]|nr:MAG: DUF2662 domain-containing protein [Actinomycetota bacterium]